MLALRPYQTETVQAAIRAVRAGQRRLLAVLATGAGKTVIAAQLASQTKGRVLMIVNRDELVRQSVEKFALTVPAEHIGVVQGAQRDWHARYLVASIQTLARAARLIELLDADHTDPFRLVIVDETHHIGAASYQHVLHALGLDQRETAGSRVLLGITATPVRMDGQSVQDFFDQEIYRKEIADLIGLGYLVPVRGLRLSTATALPTDDAASGDYDEQLLALAVDTPGRNALIAETWQQHARDRQTVVFAVNVAHAQHLAATFAARGIAADWIAGSLSLTERRRRLQAFHDQQVQVLVNCTILTEGWDEPAVNCLVMARPTLSPGLYIQMVGRGLRPHPGKTDCLVIDVTDQAHSLACTLTVLADPDATRRTPAERKKQRETEPETPDELPGTVTAIPLPWDVLGTSPFIWHAEATGPWLEAGPQHAIYVVPAGEDLWQVWLHGPDGVVSLADQPLPFAYAQGVAEDWVRAQQLTRYAAKDAAWRSRKVSPKQQALLRRLQVAFDPETLTQAEASQILRNALSHTPATPAQRQWLRAHHVAMPADLTRQQASALITQVQASRSPPVTREES